MDFAYIDKFVLMNGAVLLCLAIMGGCNDGHATENTRDTHKAKVAEHDHDHDHGHDDDHDHEDDHDHDDDHDHSHSHHHHDHHDHDHGHHHHTILTPHSSRFGGVTLGVGNYVDADRPPLYAEVVVSPSHQISIYLWSDDTERSLPRDRVGADTLEVVTAWANNTDSFRSRPIDLKMTQDVQAGSLNTRHYTGQLPDRYQDGGALLLIAPIVRTYDGRDSFDVTITVPPLLDQRDSADVGSAAPPSDQTPSSTSSTSVASQDHRDD